MSQIDLNKVPDGHKYKVSLDPDENPWDRAVRLSKDLLLFLAALGVVLTIATICIRSVLDPHTAEEEKKWAMSILTAVAGGLVGYLVRK